MNKAPRGVALISILFIVVLLSAIAYQVVLAQSLVIAQARQNLDGSQSMAYALGAESFARQVLFEDWSAATGGKKDTLLEAWAQPIAPFEIDNGVLQVQIRDMNSCFNLNSLSGSGSAANYPKLQTLLRNLSLDVQYADAWRDWVDPNLDVEGAGAEDGHYLLLQPAYRAPNSPVADVSEVRLIANMSRLEYEKLLPSICTLPTDSLKLNINTANREAILALHTSLSPTDIDPLILSPRDFGDVSEAVSIASSLAAVVADLSVTSVYFSIQIQVLYGDSVTEMATLVHRDATNGEITLISRDFGKGFQSLFL